MAYPQHIFLGLHAHPQPGGPKPMPGQPPSSPIARENVKPPHVRPGQVPAPKRFPGYGKQVFDTGGNHQMEGGS